MILYLIRHGQSANNLLAEEVRREFGEFGPEAHDAYMRQRVAEPPLTETGEAQAEELGAYLRDVRPKHRAGYEDPPDEESVQMGAGNWLGITHLYCSPMLRTLQTARPVAKALSLSPSVWLDIHEHGGVFERAGAEAEAVGFPGLCRSEMAELFPEYRVDGVGEEGWWTGAEEDRPACDARAVRVAQRLHEMAEEMPDDRIAAVSHGTFLDSLLKALLGRLPGTDFHFNHYNTAITRVDFVRSHADGGRFVVVRYTNRVDHLTPELIT